MIPRCQHPGPQSAVKLVPRSPCTATAYLSGESPIPDGERINDNPRTTLTLPQGIIGVLEHTLTKLNVILGKRLSLIRGTRLLATISGPRNVPAPFLFTGFSHH